MIEKIMKAVYILTIALVVFLGGLLITKGMLDSQKETERAPVPVFRRSMIDSQEGNAL